MKHLIRLSSVCFLSLFLACHHTDLKPETITMRVADQYKDCTGVGPQKCLWVKIGDAPTWTLQYAGIDGFTYEEGFEYTLTVNRERVENPPMDGSSVRYTLVNVIDKTKR